MAPPHVKAEVMVNHVTVSQVKKKLDRSIMAIPGYMGTFRDTALSAWSEFTHSGGLGESL